MNEVPRSYQPLWEARQEAGNWNASFGQKNTKALERYHQEHPEMRGLEEGEVYEELTK